MHLGDSVFILILALVMLGPKKTSELAGQLGKLMAEFRKASNDFKYQFNEEMRVSEQADQQKKQEAERAALPAPGAAVSAAFDSGEPASGHEGSTPLEPTILPPGVALTGEESTAVAGVAAESNGSIPSESVPYAVSAISATTGEEHPVDDHPLLRVDVIPPMPERPTAHPDAESQAHPQTLREEDGAPLHHG